MKSAKIIESLAETFYMARDEMKDIIQDYLLLAKEEVQAEGKITITGLGRFETVMVKGRTVTNLDKTQIEVPDKMAMKFRPCNGLKDEVATWDYTNEFVR